MNKDELIFELLSSVLTAVFEKKVTIKYLDEKLDIYITGIGGCLLEISENSNIIVRQCDISEEMLGKIKTYINNLFIS
ncbi:hypothetical protein [Brachyspira sp.]|uniref:hypothetical protein n=1 Tax=Brachyspira sp. TaxID=1977261 RepID=UPI003D7E5B2E